MKFCFYVDALSMSKTLEIKEALKIKITFLGILYSLIT